MLENGFAEIDGVDPASRKVQPASPEKDVTVKTNINPKGAASTSGGGKPGSQQKKNRMEHKQD